MLTAGQIKRIALDCGFDLAGIASAEPHSDAARYRRWVDAGRAGAMSYLTDYRAERRVDPRSLLPLARSILCVGKLYSGPEPYTPWLSDRERAWISRYAWGDDYHDVIREGLSRVAERLRARAPEVEYKVCVDTAPLLERSFAHAAGLGWIGRNTCVINQEKGSWFFLGELLLSVEIAPDVPAADRCGECTACIDACPTQALSSEGLDARVCLSYVTIELRGSVPESLRTAIGTHVFGCDICQDVCPWNRRPALARDPRFASMRFAPALERLVEVSEAEFGSMFKGTPVSRARYTGFLRNVAIAMGNSGNPRFEPALRRLAEGSDPIVSEHAAWALGQLATRARA